MPYNAFNRKFVCIDEAGADGATDHGPTGGSSTRPAAGDSGPAPGGSRIGVDIGSVLSGWQNKIDAEEGNCAKERSPCGIKERKPVCGIKQKPACGIKQKPACGIKQKPTCVIKQKPTCVIKQKPTCEIKQKPNIKEKKLCPKEKPPPVLKEKPPVLKEKPNIKEKAVLIIENTADDTKTVGNTHNRKYACIGGDDQPAAEANPAQDEWKNFLNRARKWESGVGFNEAYLKIYSLERKNEL